MRFLSTFSDGELLEKAKQKKMEELYSDWYYTYIGEYGDEFSNFVEEELLGYLHPLIKDMAKSFYEKENERLADSDPV